MRFVRPFLILAALLTVAAPTVSEAGAASGGLRFVECLTGKQPVTGELAVGVVAVGRCAGARAPGGKPQWFDFDGFNSLAVAGHNLYVAAGEGSSVSGFSFP